MRDCLAYQVQSLPSNFERELDDKTKLAPDAVLSRTRVPMAALSAKAADNSSTRLATLRQNVWPRETLDEDTPIPSRVRSRWNVIPIYFSGIRPRSLGVLDSYSEFAAVRNLAHFRVARRFVSYGHASDATIAVEMAVSVAGVGGKAILGQQDLDRAAALDDDWVSI